MGNFIPLSNAAQRHLAKHFLHSLLQRIHTQAILHRKLLNKAHLSPVSNHMKIWSCLLYFIISSALPAQDEPPKQTTYYEVNIAYTEGRIRMQGIYLFPANNNGDLEMGDELGTIKNAHSYTLNELKDRLHNKFPNVPKNTFHIRLFHHNEQQLINNNSILIFGQIEKPGVVSLKKTDDLSTLLKQNRPDRMSALNRVVILRKEKRLVYDLRKADTKVKLEPADIVHIPTKRVIGR